jgi:uncharacterized RDD family membrane protein YckC
MTYPASAVRESVVLASRGNRLLAQLVDGVVAAVPFYLGTAFVTFSVTLSGVAFTIGALWFGFYYLFADGLSGGQSLGKRWLGMHVVDEKTGAPCTFWQSFIRNFLQVLGPLDWIFIFGDKHQRLGDKAAGTIVVANND